jgi:hypothetical protein
LHQNQATILKDIQKEIYKTKENYYACLFEVYRNLLLGLDCHKETTDNTESKKPDDKERIKAITHNTILPTKNGINEINNQNY